jgi:hypothetical protein
VVVKQAAPADDVRAEWTPFSLELLSEWLVFALGPFLVLVFAFRVLRNRLRASGG